MPISIRYNFETNSSSMHSLSVRRTSGEYSAEDLRRSDALVGELCQDAILTMNYDRVETQEEIFGEMNVYNNQCHIWEFDMMLRHSAMQILADFRGKLYFALANAYEAEDDDVSNSRIDMISQITDKYFAGVNFRIDTHRLRGVGTNDEMLFDYLKKRNISLEEFLTNRKYIVIVNYAEYCKMKWLNMVDESKIVDLYHPEDADENQMVIKDGVWSPSAGDLYFGRSPFRVLGTVEGKARYAIASRGPRVVQEVLEIMQTVYPKLQRIEIPRSRYNPEHEDYGDCDDSALPNDIPLKEFILDKKYVIISDGDEYCVWDEFKGTKLFNHEEYPDEEIDEYYKID